MARSAKPQFTGSNPVRASKKEFQASLVQPISSIEIMAIVEKIKSLLPHSNATFGEQAKSTALKMRTLKAIDAGNLSETVKDFWEVDSGCVYLALFEVYRFFHEKKIPAHLVEFLLSRHYAENSRPDVEEKHFGLEASELVKLIEDNQELLGFGIVRTVIIDAQLKQSFSHADIDSDSLIQEILTLKNPALLFFDGHIEDLTDFSNQRLEKLDQLLSSYGTVYGYISLQKNS